ncbi:HTH_Tnp_Tc3_2 domain-containing protein [Trichonephila clavipes]|nr:HTH_Tnp_Tc3_2 domain-containing protein [Trichonephila clavipes]
MVDQSWSRVALFWIFGGCTNLPQCNSVRRVAGRSPPSVYAVLLSASIAALVDRDPMTVRRIWNQWGQDGNTECRAGSQRTPIISTREDRHVTCTALMDRAATPRTLESRIEVIGKTASVCTNSSTPFAVAWLSAWRPWLRLPLMLHYRQKRLQ